MAVTLLAAGCGTKQVTVTGANGQATTATVKNIHFANTKFVLHMGLAFGAFHRYIYKPLKYGELRSGAPHRIATLAKAALAGAFIVHELRIAREDALSSNQLRPLLVKLDNEESRIEALVPGLKHGSASASAINGAAGATNALGSQSSGLGARIHDIASNL
ncbi:MAG TPA: hypothetical protein VG405_13805 [Solirubrobacteraceae bacterium]|nr:hypothetical protein [Solirubrobacteraceae bacterium]